MIFGEISVESNVNSGVGNLVNKSTSSNCVVVGLAK